MAQSFVYITLLSSHWPELSHMATPDLKELKKWSLPLQPCSPLRWVRRGVLLLKERKKEYWETVVILALQSSLGVPRTTLRCSSSLEGLRALGSCCGYRGGDLLQWTDEVKAGQGHGPHGGVPCGTLAAPLESEVGVTSVNDSWQHPRSIAKQGSSPSGQGFYWSLVG